MHQLTYRLEELGCLHFLNFFGNLLFTNESLLLIDNDLFHILLVPFASIELILLFQFLFLWIPYQQSIILALVIRGSSFKADLSEHLLVSLFIPSHVLLVFIRESPGHSIVLGVDQIDDSQGLNFERPVELLLE